MRLQKFKTVLLIILIIVTLMFIFGNSLESKSDSKQKSLAITNLLTPVLEIFVGKGNVTDHLVRKLAHFAEFAVLGSELFMLSAIRRRVNTKTLLFCAAASLVAAAADETIQIFSNRGSQLSDVLLDFCGAITGITFFFLLYLIVIKSKTNPVKN